MRRYQDQLNSGVTPRLRPKRFRLMDFSCARVSGAICDTVASFAGLKIAVSVLIWSAHASEGMKGWMVVFTKASSKPRMCVKGLRMML